MIEPKKDNCETGLETQSHQPDAESAESQVEAAAEEEATREAAVKAEDPVAAELAEIKEQLAAKEAALEEIQQRYLRLQADFDNFRRRTRREQQEFTKMAAAGVIKALLPIIDNLERALTTVEIEKNNFAAGVEMILRQLKEVLAAEGLAPIEAVGQPFNPELHEAVSREETEDQEKINLVLEQYRQGYTLQGKLLRPAMVKVAVAAATEDKQEDIEGGE